MASNYPGDDGAEGDWMYNFLSEEDKEKAQRELNENGPSGLRKFLEQKLDEWREIPVSLILFYAHLSPFVFNLTYITGI